MKNKYQEALDEVMNNLDSLKDSYVKKRLKVLQELVDKETPKKPVLAKEEYYDKKKHPIIDKYDLACPNCKADYRELYDCCDCYYPLDRCQKCGQLIDWGRNKDEKEKE